MSDISYEEYMRSVLGYQPQNTYYDEYVPTMRFSNIQNEELENCYPDIYRLVYPMIQKSCMTNTRPLTREMIDDMTNEIYFSIEDNDIAENRDSEDRRIIRNQGLNDLIRILLLRELIGRPGGRPPRPPVRPPMPPHMRPPQPPRPPRPGMGPFNRQSYDQFSNQDIYEY